MAKYDLICLNDIEKSGIWLGIIVLLATIAYLFNGGIYFISIGFDLVDLHAQESSHHIYINWGFVGVWLVINGDEAIAVLRVHLGLIGLGNQSTVIVFFYLGLLVWIVVYDKLGFGFGSVVVNIENLAVHMFFQEL